MATYSLLKKVVDVFCPSSYLQCSNIKSLGVLLATSLVIVSDNILSDVLLLKHYQWLLLLTPQCNKQHHDCCQRETHMVQKNCSGCSGYITILTQSL